MLIDDAWAALAQTHAVELVTPAEVSADVALAGPHFVATDFDVSTVEVLHPSRVPAYARRIGPVRPLVVARRASDRAREAAVEAGVSVLVAADRAAVSGVLLDAYDRRFVVETATSLAEASAYPTRRVPGRPAWGTYALAIELLGSREAATQRDLAERTRLTQGRVSQVLSSWDWVTRTPHGWIVTDAVRGSDWLAAAYRQPRTSASFLSLDAPVPAARAVAAALEHQRIRYAVTGQVAADFYAPWARPDHATIWADQLVDLTAAGCTATIADEASVTLAVPDDPYALDAAIARDGMMLTDPWRTWVLLSRSGDTQAADRLRERLIQG